LWNLLRVFSEPGSAQCHRHCPFLDDWFVDWSGCNFVAGILSERLLLFLLRLMKSKRWQRLSILSAAMLVGFSRIALDAHYLSDVIAAIFLGLLWLMICTLLLRPMRRSVVVPEAVAVEEPRPATAVTVFDRTVDSALKL
jgi:membrane-associated phospholipid phosphatase